MELIEAAENGNLNQVKELLKAGASVDFKEERWGQSALMKASQWGHTEIVKLLMKEGASMDLQDDGGRIYPERPGKSL